jgi:hypothetical protein
MGTKFVFFLLFYITFSCLQNIRLIYVLTVQVVMSDCPQVWRLWFSRVDYPGHECVVTICLLTSGAYVWSHETVVDDEREGHADSH